MRQIKTAKPKNRVFRVATAGGVGGFPRMSRSGSFASASNDKPAEKSLAIFGDDKGVL
jgi:hypothetical protein